MVIDSNELLGHALGSCVLQRLLGRGGMGAVYLAQQARPKRQVAVKVLMPGILMDNRPQAEFLTRFRREADAVAALDHINIMPVYEYGEENDLAYIVMPYITGGTLRDKLERQSLSLEEIVSIIEQVAAGLDSAHAQGIVHRDLKPGNILFHADGRVLIADFGLAKIVKEATDQLSTLDGGSPAALTSTGTIVGTPEYLSPEQGTGNPVDYRSDVYSLGVVLYQMLAGRVPFTGASPVAVAIKHALETPPLPSRFNPSVPRAIEAVVMKAMAKKPEDRYNSAGEFARALRAAATPKSDEHRQQPTTTEDIMAPMVLHDAATLSTPPANVHSARTDKEPRVKPVQRDEQQAIEAEPTVVTTPIPPQQQPQRPLRTLQQGSIKTTSGQYVTSRPRGCQSLSMMVLGSLITLLLVVGGFVAYLHFTPVKSNQSQPNTTPTTHVTSTSNNSTPTPSTSFTAPKAAITPAGLGQLLYATPLPGKSCDTYGGQWSAQPNATLTCTANALELANNGSGSLAGTFLTALPKGASIPNDYMLQVQVTVSPNSRGGNFGVFFRNQPGSQQGGYSFLIAPSGNWSANAYDNTTGNASNLYSMPGITPVSSTATLDITVQGGDFQFYLNGTKLGGATSQAYTSGTLGLIVDSNADVYFKNLEIYALS